jgi:glyceraldehyde-3-phosphate dehydrogenase/erythrose-4-phosphate dehydrogenase
LGSLWVYVRFWHVRVKYEESSLSSFLDKFKITTTRLSSNPKITQYDNSSPFKNFLKFRKGKITSRDFYTIYENWAWSENFSEHINKKESKLLNWYDFLNHYKKDTEYCFKVLDTWIHKNKILWFDHIVPVYWEEISCFDQQISSLR